MKNIRDYWTLLHAKYREFKKLYLSVFSFPKSRKNQVLFIIGYLLCGFPHQIYIPLFEFPSPISIKYVLSIPGTIGFELLLYSMVIETMQKLRDVPLKHGKEVLR